MKRIAVIHGPNLNLLGKREVNIYGRVTLKEIDQALIKQGRKLNLDVVPLQSNSESEIIEVIQNLEVARSSSKKRKSSSNLTGKAFDGLIINPAAYTHTSVAIRDALAVLSIPVLEVHLSNIAAREDFRKTSFVSPVVVGSVMGLGMDSYLLALQGMAGILRSNGKKK